MRKSHSELLEIAESRANLEGAETKCWHLKAIIQSNRWNF